VNSAPQCARAAQQIGPTPGYLGLLIDAEHQGPFAFSASRSASVNSNKANFGHDHHPYQN
jgi:hypothetical protein